MNIDSPAGPTNMTSVYAPPSSIFPPPTGFPPDTAVEIFVGDGNSALLVDQLEKYYVWGVLNVAYDLDDQPAADEYNFKLLPDPHRPPPASPQGSGLPPLERYKQQFAKVGLIDGYGNIPNQMAVIAAVYMADQLFTFPTDGSDVYVCPPLINQYQRGNLLIHCWSGRSRSVTVAALYIWYKFGIELKDPKLTSFSQVYDMVKTGRDDSTNPITGQPGAQCVPLDSTNLTETPPTCGMQEAALTIVKTYATLFPAITFN